MASAYFLGRVPRAWTRCSSESKEVDFPAALSEEEARGPPSLPVATTSPGAVALLEILPEEYGFSEVCKCRCKEQKGYKGGEARALFQESPDRPPAHQM